MKRLTKRLSGNFASEILTVKVSATNLNWPNGYPKFDLFDIGFCGLWLGDAAIRDSGWGGGLLIRDVSVLMLRSSSLEVFRGYPLLLDVSLLSALCYCYGSSTR